MIHLFIDSNIYLNFFAFKNEHLEKLKKVVESIKKKEIILYTTQQVIDEIHRNRETKISETLKYLDELNPDTTQISDQGIEEIIQINNHILEIKKLTNTARIKILEKITTHLTPADQVIEDMLKSAKLIEFNEELIKKAKERFDRGNPPGKNGSYGDSINWECLLSTIPNGVDLNFISTDKDFSSKLDKSIFSDFLQS